MLDFSQTKSRCLIVGAAPEDAQMVCQILDAYTFDCIMAVDGGYKVLKDLDVVPTLIFGDFDSLGFIPEGDNVEIFDSHKDFTDMDWALHQAELMGFSDVVMCGGLSGSLDHSLGNLQLLVRSASHGMRVWGMTDSEVVVCLSAPGPLSSISFDEGLSGRVSVISHSDVCEGVNEIGLEYGLGDAHCLNRIPWGISNELIGTRARIWLEQGTLWVFFPFSALDKVGYGLGELSL